MRGGVLTTRMVRDNMKTCPSHPPPAAPRRGPIPPTRDPFINTPLLPLGPDDRGVERVWISSNNRHAGATGVLVDEHGHPRLYRLRDLRFSTLYSVARETEDTLLCCSWLDGLMRLHLSSGRRDYFSTGAPHTRVFAGLVYDPATRLAFAAGYDAQAVAFVYDLKARRAVRLHQGFSEAHYMRCSFPNGDGTHTIVMQCPSLEFIRWDPRRDTVERQVVCAHTDDTPAWSTAPLYRMIADEQGRWFAPPHGWYDPRTRRFDPTGPTPDQPLTFFARVGTTAYGASGRGDGQFWEWDMATGRTRPFCTIPEGNFLNAWVTPNRKLICINTYGVFYRYDTATGSPERIRVLPTDAVGHTDCLVRIDRDRILGTPFITQRFWELNLRTGQGYDCGKAAPGSGEILLTWAIGAKIYMAAYTGGELVEYDPTRHPHFPENPRVVAKPPHGLRPVAAAAAGRVLFYACSAPYGRCGSVLTRYDTRSGQTCYRATPIPDLQITSLAWDRASRSLLFGSSIHADSRSCPPRAAQAAFGRLDPSDFSLRASCPVPVGVPEAGLVGPLGRRRWLVRLTVVATEGLPPEGTYLAVWEEALLRLAAPDTWRQITPCTLLPAGPAGLFVCCERDRLELRDYRRWPAGRTLWSTRLREPVSRVFVQGSDILMTTDRNVLVFEQAITRRARGKTTASCVR